MLYRAIGVFRLATRPFRDRSVDWPVGVAAMLELARAHLRRVDASTGPHDSSDSSAGASPSTLKAIATITDIPKLLVALDISQASTLLEPIVHGRVMSAEVLRHKPGRRALIEYVVRADDRERRVLGKLRAKGLDERAFDNQRSLFDAGFNAAHSNVAVPPPIGVVPQLAMWLQEKVIGDSFIATLDQTPPPELAQRVAHAIAKLHEAAVRPARAHTAVDELKILMERLDLARRAGVDSQRIHRVAAACRALAAGIASTPLSPIHRDFYHDQMLLSPEVDYLLDVDLLSSGDAALDVGNFVAHLIELSLRRPDIAAQLSAVADELPRIYTAIRPSVSQQRIDAYTTLSLARHVHISTLFEDRVDFTDKILSVVEQRLKV